MESNSPICLVPKTYQRVGKASKKPRERRRKAKREWRKNQIR